MLQEIRALNHGAAVCKLRFHLGMLWYGQANMALIEGNEEHILFHGLPHSPIHMSLAMFACKAACKVFTQSGLQQGCLYHHNIGMH